MAVAQSEDETPTESSEPKERAGAGGVSAAGKLPAAASAASRLAAKRAAKAAAKAAKKGTQVLPEEVDQRVVAAAQAYERNSAKLWLGLGALVLAGAAVFFLVDVYGTRDHEAAEALGEGLAAARGVIVKEGEDAPDGDIETFTSPEARAKKAQESYAAAAQKYAGKLAGRWARLGEAGALAELGKHAEAEKLFAALAGDADPFIAARATEGVGFALEAQGKHAEAAAQYEKLGKLGAGEWKPLADYQRARMLVAQGKPRDAATALEALLKAERGKPDAARFPNVLGEAETLLTELSVELDDPTLRADIPRARAGAGGTNDIMEQIRLQLGQGEGGGLTPEMLQKLLGGSANEPSAP